MSPRAEKQSKALEVEPGHWVWDGLAKILEVDLFSPAWEIRHGAAMALRELLKYQGKYGGMRGKSFVLCSSKNGTDKLFIQLACPGRRMKSRTSVGATI